MINNSKIQTIKCFLIVKNNDFFIFWQEIAGILSLSPTSNAAADWPISATFSLKNHLNYIYNLSYPALDINPKMLLKKKFDFANFFDDRYFAATSYWTQKSPFLSSTPKTCFRVTNCSFGVKSLSFDSRASIAIGSSTLKYLSFDLKLQLQGRQIKKSTLRIKLRIEVADFRILPTIGGCL